jgi:hypothetical protein
MVIEKVAWRTLNGVRLRRKAAMCPKQGEKEENIPKGTGRFNGSAELSKEGVSQ